MLIVGVDAAAAELWGRNGSLGRFRRDNDEPLLCGALTSALVDCHLIVARGEQVSGPVALELASIAASWAPVRQPTHYRHR